jgi:hypothetical protein
MSLDDWHSAGTINTQVPASLATGWPTIDEAAAFIAVAPTDPALIECLAKAVSYGCIVLGDNFAGVIPDAVKTAALDYTGSTYTERIGQSDVIIEGLQGSVSLSRYRRTLLAARFVGIA